MKPERFKQAKKTVFIQWVLNQGSPLHREILRPRTEQDLGGDATFIGTLRAVSAGDNSCSENAKVSTNS